jgi:ABC-type metal ion transport system substrate-binding protein
MFKKSLIALATVLVTAAAAPAFASTDNVFGSSTDHDSLRLAKISVKQQLEQRGLDVFNVDEWGGYVRADVKLADGTIAARFFQPGSLQPVAVTDLR